MWIPTALVAPQAVHGMAGLADLLRADAFEEAVVLHGLN